MDLYIKVMQYPSTLRQQHMTPDVYHRLTQLSTMRAEILRHNAELKRRAEFAEKPPVHSTLEDYHTILEGLRPLSPLPPRQVNPIDAQIARDLILARQLSKDSVSLLWDEPRANRNSGQENPSSIYNRIRSENPNMSWQAAWDQAQEQHCKQVALGGRKRLRRG